MALSNFEKNDLRSRVKAAIKAGFDCNFTVAQIKVFGYKESTIRKYYRSFSR